MPQARALSSDEIRGLREELSSGGTPTVWFTSSAVGVPEGRSGKVISLDDPAEGDFIKVRPAGSKDVLSFSASEVTLVKPPRKRKEPEPAASASRGPAAAAGEAAPASAPAKRAPAKQSSAKQEPAKQERPAAESGKKSAGTPARRKPRQPAGATVTLTADEGGQWNVEVSTGKKRVLRPTPVAASAVAQAAKSLHDDVAAAVEPLLQAAREQQRQRVEQLQQELADAQRMLDDLSE